MNQALITWLAQRSADTFIHLTEEDKVSLFGPQGQARMNLMNQFLQPVDLTGQPLPERKGRRSWKYCQVRLDALEQLTASLQARQVQARTELGAEIAKHAAATGLTVNDIMQVANGQGPMRLSQDVQNLLTNGRKRWSPETLALISQGED